MNHNIPSLCEYCKKYGGCQADVSCHQQYDDRCTVVVSENELKRLYDIERRYCENEEAFGQLIRQREEENWNFDLQRFRHVELIKQKEDTVQLYDRKIKQLEMIIDMLNLRIHEQERRYNRLLKRHHTMMKVN